VKDQINRNWGRSAISIPVYVLACLAGIWIMFYPTLSSHFALMQTDPGDTRLNQYFLEHSFQLLTNPAYIGQLWSPSFFYPYPEVLAFSDNLFGSAPVYWFFRSILPSDLAYQWWTIAVLTLNFVAFSMLMRRFSVNPFLGSLASFLFAFGLPRAMQLGHQQLLPQFFTPLVFWLLWDFIKQPTIKRFVAILLLTYLQVLAGIYLGWFLVFSILIFVGISCWIRPDIRRTLIRYVRENIKPLVAISLGWLALLVITFWPYIRAKSVLGGRSYREIDSMLPRLQSWFSVDHGSVYAPLLSWISKGLPAANEHRLFMGFVILAMSVLAIWAIFRQKIDLGEDRNFLVRVSLLVFIVIFVLSFRIPPGISLWRFVYHLVPGASVIRAVTRIWTIADFYLLIGVTVCIDSLLKMKVRQPLLRSSIALVLCVASMGEQRLVNYYQYEKASIDREVVQMQQVMEKDCDVAYVTFTPEQPFFVVQLSAMWAGLRSNTPVVNGYSGNHPPDYLDPTKSMDAQGVLDWLEVSDAPKSGNLCVVSQEPSAAQETSSEPANPPSYRAESIDFNAIDSTP